MKTLKIFFALLAVATVLNACSIFKKGCNCPKFYKPYQTQNSINLKNGSGYYKN